MPSLAYLALGSNMGDRLHNMARALGMLESEEPGRVMIEKVSSLYETEPVGYAEQDRFLNAVAAVRCDVALARLLRLCQGIEARLGRERTIRWGPRTIDIDILLYGDCRVHSKDLQVPHPRMWERGFVIVPLAELSPDLEAPTGRPAAELARDPAMRKGVALHMIGPWWLDGGAAGLAAGLAAELKECSSSGQGSSGQGLRLPVWRLTRLAEVDSTNAVAMRMAETGAPEGMCVVAETQTGGRGRMGRAWHSPRGGLWFSVVLRPTVPARDVGRLSLVMGVAVTEAIREATGLLAMMKWPNDVVVNGKKVSGTLVEGRWRGETVEHIVAGIGINVAVDVARLPVEVRMRATTLASPCDPGAAALREDVLRLVLEKFGSLYGRFLSGGFLEILDKARAYSDTIGREIEATCPGGVVRGTAIGIDADGALVVKTCSGDVRMVSGDVSVRAAGAG